MSSHISELGNYDLYKWTVERPVEGRNRFSPEFTYTDHFSSKFVLDFFVENKTYTLSFKNNISSYALRSVKITVHVEDRNQHALPLSYEAKHEQLKKPKVWKSVLWQYNETDILKAIPDFHSNGLLIFLIIFHCPPGSVLLKKTTGKKSVQTDKEGDSIGATACLESLSVDLAKLLKKEEDKLLEEEKSPKPDVTLICGDSQLGAHRTILAARSTVFADMLHDNMVEGRSSNVNIENMEPAYFLDFVRYLYAGKLPDLTMDTAVRFYEAANKYAVAGLQRRCARFLTENMDAENAFEFLKLADAHSDVEFKVGVMEYILEEEIHRQDDPWLSFCKDQPVLANEVLNHFFTMQ